MTLIDPPNEFKLDNSPTDLISAVKFSPLSNQLLLVSSWDSSVRLYDVSYNDNNSNGGLRNKYSHIAPVLDCCFQDAVNVWSGDLLGHVKVNDLFASSSMDVGQHTMAVRCVEACSELNIVITGSWDHSIRLWDSRGHEPAGLFYMPDKVYTMAVCGGKLIVGTAGRRVLVHDLRNMSYALQRRESSLKYQTRCIRCFPNQQGFVLSSIEGRVAVEYLDPNPEVQKKKYAFKCHRIKENNGTELIYPINTIAFHSGYSTFATGGSDGFVNIWDGFNKKRLCQLHRYPNHISSLSFSSDGMMIAIASSHIFDDTEDTATKSKDNAIFIRRVTDQETKPK